jgi:uncharacterized protein YjbI with pentapeptide repeats
MKTNGYITIAFSILFFVSGFLLTGCSAEKKNTGTDSVTNSLIPKTPDTTTYKRLANFLSDEEIAEIANEETTLKSGKKRLKGLIPVPQDGDDFRKMNLDNVYWPKVSVKEGDFRGARMRSAHCEHSDFSNSDFRVADIRWTEFNYCNLSTQILIRPACFTIM